MDLLLYLAKGGGRVISRDDIIRHVWRGTLVTDDVITRSISQIRHALADDWRKTLVIETIPKRGYRLVPTVEFLVEPSGAEPAAVQPPEAAPPEVHNSPPRAAQRLRWRFAAVALLAIAIVIAAEVVDHGRVFGPASAGGSTPRVISSVMIAPFVLEGGSESNAYLGAEFSNQLIDALAATAELRVIGAGSSAALAKSARSALQGARELNVAAVITGTVRQTDAQLLVAISMLDPLSGKILHGHDYQFPKDEALAASDAIAQDVARMLGVRSTPPRSALETPTASPEAYQLYLEARYYLAKNEPGAVQQSIGFLRQAVKEDPKFAAAHASLAIALMLQADFGNRPVEEIAPEAQLEIDKAFALQPKLPQAFAGQGLIYMYTRRLEEAAESLRHATALRPNYWQAHMWLGLVAQSQWQIQRSIASYEHALDIEPLSSIVTLNLGVALDLGGFYDRAERELRRGLVSHPEFANLHWALGHVLWNRGQLANAHAEYVEAVDGGVNSSALYGLMAVTLVDMGMPEKAKEWILRGERIEPNEDMVWLAYLMDVIVSNRLEDLRQQVTDSGVPKNPKGFSLATLATLDFYNRDFDSARHRFAESKMIGNADEELLHSRWLTLAGHAPALDAAAANILGGNAAAGKAMLAQFAAFMATLRTNGCDSPGMDYEDAAIASLNGNYVLAALRLKTARLRGWREDWFLPLDPKMANVSVP
jgi:DNA-binding winged helix-turn-helix (wHTH) protein/tetratricopeptide (TPR) repeat protein